jgi:DUF4097 and DUF4098 domain-containing protein YvlB
MKRTLWLMPFLAIAALGQTKSTVTREGPYWVETVTGSFAAATNLRVAAAGAVRIQGEARGDVAYSLRRRAQAPDLAFARTLLDRIVVKSTQQGGWTVVEVTVPDLRRVSADLQIRVPKRLREVAVASRGGGLDLLDLDGAARAETAGGAINVDRVAGAVTVRTGGGAVRLGKIGGNVDCFSSGGDITADFLGAEAALNTRGGQIVVREAKGLVRAKTAGGNIRIEHAGRGVEVAAGAGLIEILEAGGPVVAETGAGSIKVHAAGNVRCESGAGTIKLLAISGGLRAITGAGGILADLSSVKGLQDSTLTTSAGDITVLIPSNLAVTVEAVNTTPGSRRIVSDFREISPRVSLGNARSEAQGSVNGGGPVLRLAASGGTIYLRRQQ